MSRFEASREPPGASATGDVVVDGARRDERGEIGAREVHGLEGEIEAARFHARRWLVDGDEPLVAHAHQLGAERAGRGLRLREERHGDAARVVDRQVRAPGALRCGRVLGRVDVPGVLVGDHHRRPRGHLREHAARFVAGPRQEEHVAQASLCAVGRVVARALEREGVEPVVRVRVIGANRFVEDARHAELVRTDDGVGERRVVRRAPVRLAEVEDVVPAGAHGGVVPPAYAYVVGGEPARRHDPGFTFDLLRPVGRRMKAIAIDRK